MIYRSCLKTLIAVLLVSTTIFAENWYVSADANVGGDGSSWETAFPTIQNGLDAADNGDTVFVADGTYTGSGNRNIVFPTKAIKLLSVNGSKNCIIDCQGNAEEPHIGFYLYDVPSSAVIQGFTITHAYSDNESSMNCYSSNLAIHGCVFIENNCTLSPGIICSHADPIISHCDFVSNSGFWPAICCVESNPEISHCTFDNNIGYDGGAVYLTESSPEISHCTFTNNIGKHGGAFHSSENSSPEISNCYFQGNMGYASGGFLHSYHSRPLVYNSLIVGNTSLKGGAIYLQDASVAVANCTFLDNASIDNGSVIHTISYSQFRITNSILVPGAYNTNPVIENSDTSSVIVEYSCLPGNWEGPGNIDADPLFAFADDPHLRLDSPCIDTGTPLVQGGLPATDLDGSPRVTGEAVDMGAFEYSESGTTFSVSPKSLTIIAYGGNDPPLHELQLRNRSFETIQWEMGSNVDWLELNPTTGVNNGEIESVEILADISGLQAGTYAGQITITDTSSSAELMEIPVELTVGKTLSVAPDGSGEYPTIQSAIQHASDGDIILAADGVYSGSGNRDIDFNGKKVTVRSESGPDHCIIDCRGFEMNPHRGVVFTSREDSNSILEGFTIRNGYAPYENPDEDEYHFRCGGAIYCEWSSPTIRNCRLQSNNAEYGGGLYAWHSSPVIGNCQLTTNLAEKGGGLMADAWSNPYLVNTVINGNTADFGGAIYNDQHSGITVVNNTLINNTSTTRAGGIYNGTSSIFRLINTILSGNQAPTNPQLFTQAADSMIVTYSLVEGGYAGEGNISSNPSFVDFSNADFHLMPDSPGSDSGSNNALIQDRADIDMDWNRNEPVSVDFDGNDRIMDNPMFPGTGPLVDMGAFEYLQDCNTNGIDDDLDISSGNSPDANTNGTPDECEPDCNENQLPDPWDILMDFSIDCNTNLVPDECEPGCNENGVPDECDIADGTSLDCNTNNVPDECEPGCNGNGVPDECDIADGTSLDCNTNGIPDECEPDCNTNGVPDDCDIDDGTSEDINQNGLPDECETDCNQNGVFDSIDIAQGTSADTNYNGLPDECEFDCNTNGIPDFLDIISGTSQDVDTNGRPDECQATWFVAVDASTNGDGTSWEDAFPSIQLAINTSGTGDTILVGDGLYSGEGNRDLLFLGKAITVRSLHGARSTIIDCDGSITGYHRGAYFQYGESIDSVFQGFTIRDGYHYEGGAISCRYSSPLIADCIFENNSASSGGAISCGGGSSPRITNSIFHGNQSIGSGGGAYLKDGSQAEVVGCLFIGNRADRGGAVSSRNASPVFTNCTVTGNQASRYAGAFLNDTDSTPEWINCILWSNPSATGHAIVNTASGVEITIRSSTVEGGWAGENNLESDPKLIFDGIDGHLQAGSPCIGTAEDVAPGILADTDLDGTLRIIGEGLDRGAFEFNPAAPAHLSLNNSHLKFNAYGGETPPTQILHLRNRGSGSLAWEISQFQSWLDIQPSMGNVSDETATISITASADGMAPGLYEATLSIEDSANPDDPQTVLIEFRVGDSPILVRPDGLGDYPTIQDAIDAAGAFSLIECADGVYFGEGNRDIELRGKPILLRSQGGAVRCIIDCAGNESDNHRGFLFQGNETAETILEGFTIKNGYSSTEGGAGIYCTNSSPTIKECVIENNTAPLTGVISPPTGTGGGVYLYQSSSVFQNCLIRDNLGSGIQCYSSYPVIENCRIENNTSLGNGGGILVDSGSVCQVFNTIITGNQAQRYGGGLSNRSDFVLVNCVVADNIANRSGGGLFSGSSLYSSVTNSIFWSNSAMSMGDQVYHTNATKSPIYSFCAIEGGWDGEGNIDEDPLFAFENSDYRLMAGSPCIDGGTLVPPIDLPEHDAQANPRITGQSVDIGAYETVPGLSGIAVSMDSIQLTSLKGDAPIAATLDVRNSGEGTLAFEINEAYSPGDPDWLDVTPAGGNSTGNIVTVQLSAQPDNLIVGRHLAELLISDAGASNSPRRILVEWVINGVVRVEADGSGDYPTIQEAIDAAGTGDVVLCGRGRYTGPGNRDLTFNGKAITIRSENGPRFTTIDCGGSPEAPHRAFAFVSNESSSSVLQGFTITGGVAPMEPVGVEGGGAILCMKASPSIVDCIFRANEAEEAGGAIFCVLDASPTIQDCLFERNRSLGPWSWGGGAIYGFGSALDLTNCIFRENETTGSGAAFHAHSAWFDLAGPSVTNCVFDGNYADADGGGIYHYGNPDVGMAVTNCTFYNNFAGYYGGGIENLSASTVVTNCILWQNLAGFFGDAWDTWGADSSFEISWSDFPCQESDCGEGNIDADPLFADANHGAFVLLADSPCIDAGDNSAVPVLVNVDLAGLGRFYDDPMVDDTGHGSPPVVDMGAYEVQPGGDADRDGDVDLADFAALQVCFESLEEPCLQVFDLSGNGSVDLLDYELIQEQLEER